MTTTEPMLQHFRFAHLPAHLQSVSYPFAELARTMTGILPGSAERTVCLRKLLEAKDCAVRAAVAMHEADIGEADATAPNRQPSQETKDWLDRTMPLFKDGKAPPAPGVVKQILGIGQTEESEPLPPADNVTKGDFNP